MAYKDKEKQREYQLAWYHKNRETVMPKAKVSRDKSRDMIRQFVWDHKVKNPCVDCGESNPIVLDFDHVRGQKSFSLGGVSRRYYKLERIKEEISKCEMRCANCHRLATHNRLMNVLP